MDVNRYNYWSKLPLILQAISEAEYLAIDLEMSGIATKRTTYCSLPSPSLQQLYEDAKEAAQTYSILQIGFTCISWNDSTKAYATKTFNAPLTPGVLRGSQCSDQLSSKLDRDIVFSSKTIDFLKANNFSFSHVFDKGIPYLSKVETIDLQSVDFLEDRSHREHINPKDLSHEAVRFYNLISSKIQSWVSQQAFADGFRSLLLTNPYNGRFNRLQKQLVHQLVGSEFPDYTVNSRDSSMTLEISRNCGPQPHAEVMRIKAITRQYGLTNIWAAMTGQRFMSYIDQSLIGDLHMERQLGSSAYEQRIMTNRPVIIGHNMLWDLCFLVQTFEGDLPTTVEGFQRLLRSMMPRIVDTKYLCTRGHHEMMPDQDLQKCFAEANSKNMPLVVPEKGFSYDKPASHEAGYDSFMTAVVFLKKANAISKMKSGFEDILADDYEELAQLSSLNNHQPRRQKIQMRRSLLDIDDDENLMWLDAQFKPLVPTSSLAPEIGHEKDEQRDDHAPARLPDWTDEEILWKKYGNKVRMGSARKILYTGPKRVVV